MNHHLPYPKIHIPFLAGEKIQMIRKPKVKAVVLSAVKRESSITGWWYQIMWDDAYEFNSGLEWKVFI